MFQKPKVNSLQQIVYGLYLFTYKCVCVFIDILATHHIISFSIRIYLTIDKCLDVDVGFGVGFGVESHNLFGICDNVIFIFSFSFEFHSLVSSSEINAIIHFTLNGFV